MSEAAGSQTGGGTTLRRSVLEEAHRRAGARLVERDGCVVVADYGDAASEYAAVRDGGAGLFDLSARGRIEVSGGEAVQFLNGMLTNDVARLGDGAWMHAALPNPQGRLVAALRVVRHADVFLMDTEPATHAPLLKALERFTLAGDFRVRDLTASEPLVSTAQLSIQGARSAGVIGKALGEQTARVERGRAEILPEGAGGQPLIIIRATHTAEDGFDIFLSASSAESVWDSLVSAGATPAGFDALEVLRVEAGVPRYGVDATEANVVTEVVDEAEAVSYTKGCYVGQEIIARIHWRGHVAKKLTGLIFARDADAPTDARLRDCAGGREAGRITSSVYSPRLRRHVALAVVRHEHLSPGNELRVFDGETEVCAAHVAELPLVRGSWYAASEEGAG